MDPNINPQNPQKGIKGKIKTPEEKLKFLRREEINTMQKDVGRLREAEAREERTRISQVKTTDEIKKEKELKPPQAESVPVPASPPQREPERTIESMPITAPSAPKIQEKPAPAAPAAPAVPKELEALTEEKRRIERDLSWLPEEKVPLEKQLKQLQNEIETIQSTELGPVLREEKQIEEVKKIIEEQERRAGFQERQIVESKRWEIERQRKAIEEKKWQIESKVEEKDQNIKKIKLKLSELAGKEREFTEGIQKISEQAKGAGLQEEKIVLRQKLADINTGLQKLESDFQNISLQKRDTEKNLNEILSSEKALEEEIVILEEKEAKAANLSEQKEVEQKRWETDSVRKKTEEEKWQQQAKNKETEKQYSDILTLLQKQKEEKTVIESKIKEINIFLEKAGLQLIEPEAEQAPPITREPEITVAAPPPPPPAPFFTPEQKIPVPKKELGQAPLSGLKRILIRFGILAIILAVGAAAAWFFIIKDRVEPAPAPSPSPSVSESPMPIVPEVTPPVSLISLIRTKNLGIETYAELQNTFFDNIMQPINDQEEFSRVLIKNTAKNEFLGIKEFFEAFEVAVPEGFYDKVDNNFTLFTYASSGETRLGFIAKIKDKEGFSALMATWESVMQKDFNQLFTKGMKKTQPALSNIFRNAYFKTQMFRYQTFAANDFGICYGIISKLVSSDGAPPEFNDYLVFTTSGKSMLKIIDLIQNQ